MNRDARIRRLPLALAIGLRLHEAGAADALIAVGLGIEPEGVPPVLELAKAKLNHLAAGEPDQTETAPDPCRDNSANCTHLRPEPGGSRILGRVNSTVPEAAARAAVMVAARLGVASTGPVVLADGANVIVHLSPAPVVAKVAASTPAVRPDVGAWLQRELDVALFLARRGAPVLEPSPELPATPHHGDGHVMSFWRYLPPEHAGRPDEGTIGSMLRDLHAALRHYPGVVPVLAPLGDIPAFLARPRSRLDAGQKAALAAAYARLTAELDPAAGQQVLHGDAGVGNLMAAAGRWVWHDFEDTCAGPVAWDLAATTASPRLDAPRILAAYGTGVDAAQLAVCQQLRRLNLTIWYALYAERLPELGPRSAELLAAWPVP